MEFKIFILVANLWWPYFLCSASYRRVGPIGSSWNHHLKWLLCCFILYFNLIDHPVMLFRIHCLVFFLSGDYSSSWRSHFLFLYFTLVHVIVDILYMSSSLISDIYFVFAISLNLARWTLSSWSMSQIGNEDRIHVYYARSEDDPNFYRRCYWLLDKYVLCI